jgi:hypothetical protein
MEFRNSACERPGENEPITKPNSLKVEGIRAIFQSIDFAVLHLDLLETGRLA